MRHSCWLPIIPVGGMSQMDVSLTDGGLSGDGTVCQIKTAGRLASLWTCSWESHWVDHVVHCLVQPRGSGVGRRPALSELLACSRARRPFFNVGTKESVSYAPPQLVFLSGHGNSKAFVLVRHILVVYITKMHCRISGGSALLGFAQIVYADVKFISLDS